MAARATKATRTRAAARKATPTRRRRQRRMSYECPVCGPEKTFESKQGLLVHGRRMHKGDRAVVMAAENGGEITAEDVRSSADAAAIERAAFAPIMRERPSPSPGRFLSSDHVLAEGIANAFWVRYEQLGIAYQEALTEIESLKATLRNNR